jgi:hypothetical protein
VTENWRNWYKELMQLFGDLNIPSFFRKSQLICVGHVRRMDSKRKVKYAIIIPREVD